MKTLLNIKKIKSTIKKNQGFDVIIVVSSKDNCEYWKWRLPKTRKKILPQKTKVICVEERWKHEGGAGQLLGTLNAFKAASKKIDLKKMLKKGKTIAIYHIAGKGKRMAPLCGTEKNNKPAIKLPKPIKVRGKNNLISLLEAVIYSTQIFAKSRGGRLCVFWGDQIIIPSRDPSLENSLPVEIFGLKKQLRLSKKEWEKEWKSYGILIPQPEGGALQREKLTWNKIKESGLLKTNAKGEIFFLQSLGCFSMSYPFLKELLEEFYFEIKLKNKKLDTDPHLWMPLTSSKEEYIEYGKKKTHWHKIEKLRKRFYLRTKNDIIVSAKNLGINTLWWDYGNLVYYFKNIIKMIEKSPEAEAQRLFFDIENFLIKKLKKNNLKIKNSIIVNSEIKGKIKNSVVLNSKIEKANLENAVIINSEIKEIRGENSLLYYVREEDKIKTLPNEVITDIKLYKDEKVRMKTKLSRDGKKDWTIRLPENPFSYSEVAKLISKINGVK